MIILLLSVERRTVPVSEDSVRQGRVGTNQGTWIMTSTVSKKQFGLAVAAYLLPTFPLGYVWHLVLFKQKYDELHLYRAEVIIPMGLATMFIQAILFASLYPRIFSTGRERWVSSALQFFAVFSVLAWSFTTLPVAAKYQMASVPQFLMLETTFTLVHFAIVSPLIALAYRDSVANVSPQGAER